MKRAPRIPWGGLAARLQALRRAVPGPDSGWPLFSSGVAVLLLAVLLVVEIGFAGRLEAGKREIAEVVDFVVHHPAVELDPRLLPAVRVWLPDFEGNETFAFLRRGDTEVRQKEFDALSEQALGRVDSHPQRSLGLIPARLDPLAFATHPLVHAGWIHGLGAAALLLLIAPLLERAWGAGRTAGLLGGALLLGAGVFVASHRGLDRPLLGIGAGLGALAAALAVTFRGRRVEALYWLPLELPALPAWSLALAWLSWQGLVYAAGAGGLPAGFGPAISWPADLTGLACGALAALGLERAGWVKRPEPETLATAAARRSRPFDYERVIALRARGQLDRAYTLLEAEVTRSSRNRDAVVTFFEMSVERGAPERAVSPMRRLISEELRRGAAPVAVAHWRTLCEHVQDPRLDPGLLLRLVPSIREEDGDEIAVSALRQVASVGMARLAPAQARQLATLAAGLDATLAREAAQRALEAPELLDDARRELEELVAAGEADDSGAPPGEGGRKKTGKPPPPNVFYAEQDRSLFGSAGGELGELTAAGAEQGPLVTTEVAEDASGVSAPPLELTPDSIEVTAAVPLELEPQALSIQVPQRGRARVPFEHLHAVATVGVRGLGPRPVVLIDLLVSGPEPSGRPRRVVRLRSDAFDPRSFAPDASSPLAALRAFVAELIFLADAESLPGDDGAIPVYTSIEAYTRELLLPQL